MNNEEFNQQKQFTTRPQEARAHRTQSEEASDVLSATTGHDTLSPKVIKNACVDLRKQFGPSNIYTHAYTCM